MAWWEDDEETCVTWVHNVPCPGENKICFLGILGEEDSPDQVEATLRSVLPLADTFLLCEKKAPAESVRRAKEVLAAAEKSAQMISGHDSNCSSNVLSYVFSQAQEKDLAQGADFLLWLEMGEIIQVLQPGENYTSIASEKGEFRRELLLNLEGMNNFTLFRLPRPGKERKLALARNDRVYSWEDLQTNASASHSSCGEIDIGLHIQGGKEEKAAYFCENKEIEPLSAPVEKIDLPNPSANTEKSSHTNIEAYLALGNGLLAFDGELAARSFQRALSGGCSKEQKEEASQGLMAAALQGPAPPGGNVDWETASRAFKASISALEASQIPPQLYAGLVETLFKEGKKEESKKTALRAPLESWEEGWIFQLAVALVFATEGENEAASYWLSRLVQEGKYPRRVEDEIVKIEKMLGLY